MSVRGAYKEDGIYKTVLLLRSAALFGFFGILFDVLLDCLINNIAYASIVSFCYFLNRFFVIFVNTNSQTYATHKYAAFLICFNYNTITCKCLQSKLDNRHYLMYYTYKHLQELIRSERSVT